MEFVVAIVIYVAVIVVLWFVIRWGVSQAFAPTFFRLGADSARGYIEYKDSSTLETWLAIGDDLSKNRITGNRKNYVAGFNSVLVANGLEPVK